MSIWLNYMSNMNISSREHILYIYKLNCIGASEKDLQQISVLKKISLTFSMHEKIYIGTHNIVP